MSRRLRWLLGSVGLFLALVVIVVAGGYLWLRGSIAQIDGTATIAGLEAPVEVLRDAHGLVTIRAGSMHDATVALGYVHAQDRLAQMEFIRRMGAGRLSEVLGEATVELDRLMRTLGFARVAEANLARLSAETLAATEAYAAGVNAFLADPGGPLPIEFQILGFEPEPWRPVDSLLWGRLMALQLSSNWPEEALRLSLARRLTAEQIDFLWRPYPEDAPIAIGDMAAARGLAPPRPGAIVPWAWAPKDASNSWALAGARSASGAPILANDLHLGLNNPSQWYLARIETPELTLAGATAPGVPFLIAGHNGHIAWAFTSTHSDTQDLFVERLTDGADGRYDTPEGPRAFETREEVIKVRDGEPVRVTVRETRHGPVLSDIREELREMLPEARVIALAWPALRPDDRSGDALYALNRARDWAAFLDAMEDFHSPQQNVLYADRAGTIGFLAPGRVPMRAAGDGRAPVPGWTGEFDWRGEIPFEELPRLVDPAAGRIVVANNKIVPDDYPHLIAADWESPHRAERIEQLIAAAGKSDAEASAAWQRDVVSLGARALLPRLLKTAPRSARGEQALALLADWDGRMAREASAPLVYHAWLRAANRAILADELGPDFSSFQRADADLLTAVLTRGEAWCDNVETDAREGCAAVMAEALETALSDLEARYGGDMEDWRWGRAHLARFQHPFLGRLPLVGSWFSVPVETGGGDYTLNRGGVSLREGRRGVYANRHGATFRAVYDLADLDASRFMITMGQSGNPLSPFYGNLAEPWRDGLYLRLDGQPASIEGRLRLTPR